VVRADFQLGIIGAGFGGLIAALELKRAGRHSFVVFERGHDVGGVWRDNVYPGCACDIPSQLYSISARPNPEWTSNFPTQPEILAYLRRVAAQDGLLPHIRFNKEIVLLRFIEEAGCWKATDQTGATTLFQAVIVATGPQSRPYVPTFKGAKNFSGISLHSSRWDPSLDLSNKRVSIVGSGASAVQILPAITAKAKIVTLFQRSPPWILPRGAHRLSRFTRWAYRRLPTLQMLTRTRVYWLHEFLGLASVASPLLNRTLAAIARLKLRRAIRDLGLRRALTPDYKFGCKRVLLSDDFYPALNRPNVRLVTVPIAEILPDAIVTIDGERHAADCIVYATGFTVADADGFLRVEGLGGRVLAEEWSTEGPEAFLGCTVSGYPNLLFLLGPNSGLGHSSAIHVIESQMAYICGYLKALDDIDESSFLDLFAGVQRAYNTEIQLRLANTVWASGCRSWYLTRGGKNTTIFPGLTHAFRKATARFNRAHYRVQHALGAAHGNCFDSAIDDIQPSPRCGSLNRNEDP
jgi:cation diffusion facilitator CzcD-associated flavoprotein CzcO